MKYDRDHPFFAKIVERKVLNEEGSSKATFQVTLNIEKSGIRYQPGDSVAVLPENSAKIVDKTLRAIGAGGRETIEDPKTGETLPFFDYLKKKANISKVTPKWISFLIRHLDDPSERKELQRFVEPDAKEEIKRFCEEYQLWDLCSRFQSLRIRPQDFVLTLAPLLPRFYSIASSQKANEGLMDLVIAHFNYSTNERVRFGVASHYLCFEAPEHENIIPIYPYPAHAFSLPDLPHVPIIMIGPGTGVAPYRAFLQERKIEGSPGKNWLFFGDRNRKFDFLYRDFWEQAVAEGHLKLSVAFSRDQSEKTYVQDRMREEGAEFWKWLTEDAVVYVCGDAKRMAKDVDDALREIIREHGNMSEEKAKDYVREMKAKKRYLRDVY